MRRMFNSEIVETRAFLEMPDSAQNLYFHLGLNCDDDGFIDPFKVMLTIRATEDSLKILIAKQFVIRFNNGVVVITHHRKHNTLKNDRYVPTIYQTEFKQLELVAGVYTTHSSGSKPDPLWIPTNERTNELNERTNKHMNENNDYESNDSSLAKKPIEVWREKVQSLKNSKEVK